MTGPRVHPLLKAEILRSIHVPLACFSVYLSRMLFFLVVERFVDRHSWSGFSLNTYYRSCHTLGIFPFLVFAFCLNICNILTLSLAIPFVVIKLMHCFCTVVGYFFQLIVCCFGCFAINYAFLQFQLRFLWQVLAESTVRDTIHESVSNHFIFQGAKWTCISSVRSEKA